MLNLKRPSGVWKKKKMEGDQEGQPNQAGIVASYPLRGIWEKRMTGKKPQIGRSAKKRGQIPKKVAAGPN